MTPRDPDYPTVGWARYGPTGFMRKGSLSLTHRRTHPNSGETLCGRSIPQPDARSQFSRPVDFDVADVGRAPCVRCEVQLAMLRDHVFNVRRNRHGGRGISNRPGSTWRPRCACGWGADTGPNLDSRREAAIYHRDHVEDVVRERLGVTDA